MNQTQMKTVGLKEVDVGVTKREGTMVTVVPQYFIMNGMIFNPSDFDRMFKWNIDAGEYVVRSGEDKLKSCDEKKDEEKYFDRITNVINETKKQFAGEKYKVAVGMQMFCNVGAKDVPTVDSY